MPVNIKGHPLYFSTAINTKGLSTGAAKSKGILGGLKNSITGMDVFAGIAISGTLAFAKLSASSFEFAKDFEMAMLEVQTISQSVKDDFAGMSAQIIAVGAEVPDTAVGVAKAFYQIVSAGNDGAKAMDILRSSTKLAVGTITDTETAADTLTGIMNAYGSEIGDVASVSDDLFTIIKNGKTTMAELAPSIVQVTGLSAQAGLSWKDLATAYATGTKTIKTDILTTGIKGFLTAIITKGKDAEEEAKRLGLDFGILALQTKGLAGFLQDVIQKTDGNIESMAKLFPNVRGLTGVLSLAGEEGKIFAQQADNMAKSTGAVTEAFDIMIKSGENQAKVLKNNIAVALKPLGDMLLGTATDMRSSINEMFATGEMDKVIEVIARMAKIVGILTASFVGYKVAILAATLVTKSFVIWQKVQEAALMATWVAQVLVKKGFKAMIIEMKALSAVSKTTGFGLIVAGIVAVVLAVKAFKKETDELTKIQEIQSNSTDRYNNKLAEEKSAMDKLFGVLKRTKKGTEERAQAIEDINKSYSSYLPNLLTEKSSTEDIAAAYESLNAGIEKKIRLQVNEAEATSLLSEQFSLQKEYDALVEKSIRKFGSRYGDDSRKGREMSDMLIEKNKLIYESANAYQEVIDKVVELRGVELTEEVTDGGGGSDDGGGGSDDGGGGSDSVVRQDSRIDKLSSKSPIANIKASKAFTRDLLKLVQSTNDKLKQIEAKYFELRIGILKNYTGERRVEALRLMEFMKEAEQEAVKEAAANFEFQSGKYKDMAVDIQTLSLKQLIDRKQNLSSELSSVIENIETEKKLRLELAETEEEINNKRLDNLDKAMFAMDQLRGVMEDTIGTESELMNSLFENVNTQLSAAGKILSGDLFGGIVEVLAQNIKNAITFTTIYKGVNDDMTESMAQLNHELALHEIAMRSMTGEDLVGARKEQLDLINQQIEATKALMEAEEAAQKGYLFGLIKKDTTDPEAIRQYEAQLAELYAKQGDIHSAEMQRITGTTADAIADGIVQGFSEGKSAQQVFADTFEDMMRNAMINGIKESIMNDDLKKWVETFAEAYADGDLPTDEELIELKKMYGEIVNKSAALFEGIDDILGPSGSSPASGLTGAIRGVTEQTAGILAGQMNSIRINVATNVLILQDMSGYLSEISMNTTYNHNLKLIYDLMKKNQSDTSLRGAGLQ